MSIRRFNVAAALLLSVALSRPAWAHAHLLSQTPAANSAVRVAPQVLRLKFSEALELKFTTVKISGPDDAPVATGMPSLDPRDRTMLIIPVDGTLLPGRYTVEWRATATDTHKTQGSYDFTLKP